MTPPPTNWRFAYEQIKTMRAQQLAPVDTMGCTKLMAPGSTPAQTRFQILISLLLSSQTRDEVTAGAMRRLHEQFQPLRVEAVLETDEQQLASLLYPVSFYRRKAHHMRQVATILREQYASDVPSRLADLLALPGIGPKMALLALQAAWHLTVGIGVDVHVHRITNRLGWVHTRQPEETRRALEEWLPHELWEEINPLMVGFGQTTCLPLRPRCGDCRLQDICPSSRVRTRRE